MQNTPRRLIMAACTRCGKQVGFLKTLCNECKTIQENEQKAIEREKAIQAEQERERQAQEQAHEEEQHKLFRDKLIQKTVHDIWSKAEMGQNVFLYDFVYRPVDSIIVNEPLNSEFFLGNVRSLGIDGWDVVAVIPKTTGVALTNRSAGSSIGESWGAGLGGNVAGVYLVLKKEVGIQSRNPHTDEEMQQYVSNHIVPCDVRHLMKQQTGNGILDMIRGDNK
jgi:hypothetical protein